MLGGNGNMMPGQGGQFPDNALAQLLGRQMPGMPGINPRPPMSGNPLERGSKYFRPGGAIPNSPPGSNPAGRPPDPFQPSTPPPPAAPASQFTPPAPGTQAGQYGTGRTGDGSQTPLMTPDVQAWINQMLHGPGLNTGWRQTMQMDPNDILGSIERASGQKYQPGGFQMPMPGMGGY